MTTTRRVGVNLAWLVPGVVGGSEEATLGALRAAGESIAAGGTDLEIVLFALPDLLDVHPDLADRFEVRTVDVGGRNKVRRVLAETTELPRLAAAAGLSLLHHAGGVVPFRSSGPMTLAVHDTQPLDLPANFSPVKRWYLGAMIPRSVRRASAVTVPSAFVRQQLVARVGVDPAKVAVVPWSVPTPPLVEPAAAAAVRRRLGVGDRYALYPAISYVHKNHAVLLDAMAQLGADGAGPLDLVLTGAPGPLDDEIRRRSSRPDLAGRVHVLGRIARSDLDALIAGAAVVAVPSRYEGFGLPALESLAAGRPTVVSSAGSLPEVTGGAALVVDPDDVEGWARALRAAVDDEDVRARLVPAGLAVAASCTPQRTATALIDVWLRCLDGDTSSVRPARNPS